MSLCLLGLRRPSSLWDLSLSQNRILSGMLMTKQDVMLESCLTPSGYSSTVNVVGLFILGSSFTMENLWPMFCWGCNWVIGLR